MIKDSWFQRDYLAPAKPKQPSGYDQNQKVVAKLTSGAKIIVRYGDVTYLVSSLPTGQHIVCYSTFDRNSSVSGSIIDRMILSVEPPCSEVLRTSKRDWRR